MTKPEKAFKPLWVKPETHELVTELSELTGRNKSKSVHVALEVALRTARRQSARQEGAAA